MPRPTGARRKTNKKTSNKESNQDNNGEQDVPTAAEEASAPVLEIKGARATIRLNRPKHLNRLQSEDLGDLIKLFDRIEADAAIRVLVLTGTGRAFSAGYDLNSVADRATSAKEQQSTTTSSATRGVRPTSWTERMVAASWGGPTTTAA